MDADTTTLLTLASLTYRGFFLVAPPKTKAVLLDRTLRDGLARYASSWDLVWGPATSHLATEAFDSCAMYAVRAKKDPPRLVIAVRGTNPIALGDWIFGDFDVSRTVAWPFDPAAGCVSMSTALGLRDLLKLAWLPPADSLFDDLIPRGLVAQLLKLPTWLDGLVRPDDIVVRVRRRIEGVLTAALARGAVEAKLAAMVDRICARHVGAADVDIDWKGPTKHGIVELLAKETSKVPLDIVVTGHSKGGALAPALAVWLSDTQARWDQSKGSTIRYHAFAGPTPGDAAFATHATTRLGRGSYRTVNTNDLVTHAWDSDDMTALATLYDGRLSHLAPLLEQVNDGLRAAKCVYGHIGLPTEPFAGPTDLKSRELGMEIIHQHLDAYLEEAKLGIGALDLFLG